MTRHPGRDEQGRPIVAELGRAETADEIATRKAESSRRHRVNQTALNLAIAVAASLLIVAFLVVVVVRPDAEPLRDPVDVPAAAAAAQPGIDERLVVPGLPEGWWSNRARLTTASADGVAVWEIGLITADEGYLELAQGIDANPSWLAAQLQETPAGPSVTIAGVEWTSYDRRGLDDPGNLAYALATEAGGSTLVISGDASEADFTALAEAVAAELAR